MMTSSLELPICRTARAPRAGVRTAASSIGAPLASASPRRSSVSVPSGQGMGRLAWRLAPALVLAVCFVLFGLGAAPVAAAQDDAKPPTADVQSPSDQDAPAEAQDPAADNTASIARQATIISSLTIFVLAIFVGFEVITKVPPTLHTPLMSGSNAISGITIVGAIIIAGHAGGFIASSVGFLAVVFATINAVGGFLVTHRMLSMFKKR